MTEPKPLPARLAELIREWDGCARDFAAKGNADAEKFTRICADELYMLVSGWRNSTWASLTGRMEGEAENLPCTLAAKLAVWGRYCEALRESGEDEGHACTWACFESLREIIRQWLSEWKERGPA